MATATLDKPRRTSFRSAFVFWMVVSFFGWAMIAGAVTLLTPQQTQQFAQDQDTLPLMAPILLLLAFRDAILTLQESFTTVFLTTGGGPYYATYTLPMLIYEQGFGLLLFGAASAALWVLYALTGLIVLGLYLIARQWQIGTTEETFVL